MQCSFGVGRTLDWELKEIFSHPGSTYPGDLDGLTLTGHMLSEPQIAQNK